MVLIDHGADLNVQAGDKYDYKVRDSFDYYHRTNKLILFLVR